MDKSHKAIFQDFQAFAKCDEYRQVSGPVVFTNGCFDILHEGHLYTLKEAKKYGQLLILGLNSDASVSRLKGADRPINPWQERASALIARTVVDVVIKFTEDTPISLIKSLRPNVITKGGDYKMEEMIGASFVKSYGGKVIITPFLEGFSTTNILEEKR